MKPLVLFQEIEKVHKQISHLLKDFDGDVFNFAPLQISTMTKKILAEMVKRDTKGQELKKLAYKLEHDFFDEVFDNFLSLSHEEQLKFIELLSLYKKRVFKNKIYQNILINYNHENTKKMVYLLSNTFKPTSLALPYSDFLDIVTSPPTSYIFFKKNYTQGIFSFAKQIEPTCKSPLGVEVLKSIIKQATASEYLVTENETLYHFLLDHFTDDEGAEYGLRYLKIFNYKQYDQRIISYIIKCKNNIQHKYRLLAEELDGLLYKLYEYNLNTQDFAAIADELAMTLTDKIISEAFGDDERSQFWKKYTSSIVEPILFVKLPVTMFMMKFNSIGIIEYIDVGNATYLYEDKTFMDIKNKILSSAVNCKNILNLNSILKPQRLKEITKTGNNKYIHRGSWKIQFQNDMKRKYGILKTI